MGETTGVLTFYPPRQIFLPRLTAGACAHQYCIFSLTLNNTIYCMCITVRVDLGLIDINKTQSNR